MQLKRSGVPSILMTGEFNVVVKVFYEGKVAGIATTVLKITSSHDKPVDDVIWG